MSYFIACIRYTWFGCVHPNYHASTFFLYQGMTMYRGCGTGVSREGRAQHVHGKNNAKQRRGEERGKEIHEDSGARLELSEARENDQAKRITSDLFSMCAHLAPNCAQFRTKCFRA